MIFLKREDRFVLDSSSIFDERVLHLFEKRFLEGKIFIPSLVRAIIKRSGESAERAVQMLKKNAIVEYVTDKGDGAVEGICVLKAAQKRKAKVITASDELCRLAKFYPQVRVIDIRDLHRALIPIFTPNKVISVRVLKRGLHQNEGVGYIEGVKIIVENGAKYINQAVNARVSTMLISETGSLVFSAVEEKPLEDKPPEHQIQENIPDSQGKKADGIPG